MTQISNHSPEHHDSCWHCIPNTEGKLRRNPTIDRIKRNLPMVESAVDVVTKASQSKELSTFLQVFNGSQDDSVNGLSTKIDFIKTMGQIRFVAGIMGMLAGLGKMIQSISEIVMETFKGRIRERDDAIIRLGEGVIISGDAIASFGKSLSMSGMIDQTKILNWAIPLGYVSTLLSSITIYINWRAKKDSIAILDKINEGTDLAWLANEINDPKRDGDYYLQKNFEVNNREKFGAQVAYIIDEGHAQNKEYLRTALKDRITDKISSHNKVIVSAIIGIFASLCMFFPVLGLPMLFTGVGLAVISGAISVHKYLIDKRSINLFEKRINDIKQFEDIPVRWIKDNAHYAIPCLDYEQQGAPVSAGIELSYPKEMFQTQAVALPLPAIA